MSLLSRFRSPFLRLRFLRLPFFSAASFFLAVGQPAPGFEYLNDEDEPVQRTTASRHSRLRIAVDGGLSHTLWQQTDDYTAEGRKHEESMQNGLVYGASGIFFVVPKGGIGIAVNQFAKSRTARNIVMWPGTPAIGRLTEDSKINFVGGDFVGRHAVGSRLLVVAGLAVGYAWSDYDVRLDELSWNAQVRSLGLQPHLDWDFFITRHVAIGIGGRYSMGSSKYLYIDGKRKRIDIQDSSGTDWHYTLDRLDAYGGVRLYF